MRLHPGAFRCYSYRRDKGSLRQVTGRVYLRMILLDPILLQKHLLVIQQLT